MQTRRFTIARVALLFCAMAITLPLMCRTASAQQPPTTVPANPNWCSDVPASPPPPRFTAAEWASLRQRCTNSTTRDDTCGDMCEGARELWRRAKAGQLNQPLILPSPTNELQGPFPLEGGAKGYILPLPPTPAAEQTPGGPQSFAVPAAASSPGWWALEHRAAISQRSRTPPELCLFRWSRNLDRARRA